MCFDAASGDDTGHTDEDGTRPCQGVEGFPPEYPTEEGGKYHVAVCERPNLCRGCKAVSSCEQDLTDGGQKADKNEVQPYSRMG